MTDKQELVEKLSKKIIEVVAQKAELAEYETNLRAKLAELVDDGDNFVGEYKINRRMNVRFDASTAKKNLTKEQLAKISVSKPDATLAKKVLEPADLAKCQKTFSAVVQVGLRDD